MKERVYNAGIASILKMPGLENRKNHGWRCVGVSQMVLCPKGGASWRGIGRECVHEAAVSVKNQCGNRKAKWV